jgi:glycosyltransferase involved in cell wall biosynthesis
VTASPGLPAGPGRPPSLLYLATVPQPIRNFYLPYAAHFRRRGWRLTAAARDAASQPILRDAFDDVVDLPISRSIRDWRNYTQAVRAIRRLVDHGPDIVHVHTPIASFLTRVAVRTLPADRRPSVVYTAHGFHFHRGGSALPNAAFRFAERLAGRWTDRLIVINDEDEQAAIDAHLVPRRRLVRMPGVGVDVDHYDRAAIRPAALEAVRRDLGAGPETPVFVIVGELHPNKRHRDALAALAALQRQDAQLWILGDGVLRDELATLATRLGLEDRVRFLGFVEDVRPPVAGATALLLMSRREGLPRAVLEAMALGTPVIVSASRGSVELVQDGCGFVVPVGAVSDLAAAMARMIDDPTLAHAMADRGRRRVVDRYGLAGVLRQHERMYEALLDDRSGGPAGGVP